MALSASTVWEVRGNGTDTNGGGYVSGGTDMSVFQSKNSSGGTNCQSTTNNLSTTDAVAAGTTTITSAAAAFTSAITGNLVYFTGGTGSIAAQWRQATYVSATSITIDASIASSTGMTMNIGGALLSPAIACANSVAGNIIYLQAGTGTFSITSATTNVAQGTMSPAVGVNLVGYTSTRTQTNTDGQPTVQLNVSTATMFTLGSGSLAYNIKADGNTQTSAKLCNGAQLWSCTIINFNTQSGGTNSFFDCSATTNSAGIFNGGIAFFCEAYANTATPFSITSVGCISSGNTGASTDGFSVGTNTLVNCTAVSNGRDGFRLSGNNVYAQCVNCIAESNTGWGFNASGTGNFKQLINCATYNNTSGTVTGTVIQLGAITQSAGSYFTTPASNIYTLNNTTGQGALLRGAGYPALFPRGTTASYPDVGAAQHQDAGGGTTGMLFMPHMDGV